MQPTDWGEAFRIVGGGLLAVFFIMSLLATITHFFGKYFVALEAKKKAREAEQEAAEKEGAK